MVALTIIGRGWTALALVPMVIFPRTRRAGLALTAVIVVQVVVVWALKGTVRRVRPWLALDLHDVFGAPTDFSFPSGHAAGSFSVAAFLTMLLLATRVKLRYVWSALAVAAAAAISISRVYLGVHYPSDVLVGALIGGTVGALGGIAYLRRNGRAAPTCA